MYYSHITTCLNTFLYQLNIRTLNAVHYMFLFAIFSPEGKNVVVRYRAGREGFVILNPEDVLPKNI